MSVHEAIVIELFAIVFAVVVGLYSFSDPLFSSGWIWGGLVIALFGLYTFYVRSETNPSE